ncbi:hypothetical protein JS533_013260 [Bifidobacterium amazonense]|uniref:Uncharacterized protein n=1 Tax=Bifidobacterium amazonense TaxID=2809027 RepID=A0ABS9VYN3_9BIFI|nr:hypothetical protein [Bifidobacterium amazonense]MCH9277218.1 hypothetical protein [Bifidobacterium amazonense]
MSTGRARDVDGACRREIRGLVAERDLKESFYETKLYILCRRRTMNEEFGTVYPA